MYVSPRNVRNVRNVRKAEIMSFFSRTLLGLPNFTDFMGMLERKKYMAMPVSLILDSR